MLLLHIIQQAKVDVPALTHLMSWQLPQFLQQKSSYLCTADLESLRILETQHLALHIKNLWFKCNGMHTFWHCATIWRKIKVEQLISYMSIFSKETWYQAVKTRNLAMQASAKDRASCNILTVQRGRHSFNTWLLPAIILFCS